jgi:chaperonin GroES
LIYENQEAPSPENQQSADIEAKIKRKVLERIEQTNIADELDEEDLTKIGEDCKKGFDADVNSRKDWDSEMADWLKLASQIREDKSFPWKDASNVKYPLISTAAMQFSARAYPSLVPGDGRAVKARIYGKDPTGEKGLKAERVASFMNFQITYDIPEWEEDMDKMLISSAVVGNTYKKTFYDIIQDKIESKLVYVENLIVDYWAESLDSAERISEILYLSPRLVAAKKKKGAFLDIDYEAATTPEKITHTTEGSDKTVQTDVKETTPYQFIEQHTYLDLDKDGIMEPYVVTFHYKTGKVARITARYSEKDILLNEDGDVYQINPIQYYTKFGFIPNPNGSFYDMGFGSLLGPINESVNTLVNQLIDSGTLNNLQAGWIGKGLRLKMGESSFSPGEWKVVNAVGDDLRKQIVPLLTKEPSATLFNLLGMLVQSGKELASVAEIFTGKLPGQNTKATTVQESIEQGMKVFTAIYKRVYRSLEKEFKKIYRLNKIYINQEKYISVLDDQVGPDDFNDESYDICPAADPTASTASERLEKAMMLLPLLQLGTIDPMKVTMRILQAQEQPNWQELIPGMAETGQPAPPPPPPPDPKVIAMQQKAELDMAKGKMDMAAKQQEMEMNQRSAEMKLKMQEQENQVKLQSKVIEAQIDQKIAAQKAQAEALAAHQKMAVSGAQANQQMAVSRLQTGQQMALSDAQHRQKMQQAKEAPKSKTQNSQGGSSTQSRKRSKKN